MRGCAEAQTMTSPVPACKRRPDAAELDRSDERGFRERYALTPLVPRARDPGDPGRWQTVCGKPLAALAQGWRSTLGG